MCKWSRQGFGAAFLCALLPGFASAQVGLRPGDERPPLEDFAPDPEDQAQRLELPPVPLPAPGAERRLSDAGRVFVETFVFEGNTAISNEALFAVTAPYTGRTIRSDELLAARDAVTQAYVERGFITSGAVIPDQQLDRAQVTIRVIEGTLTGVHVRGADAFRPEYFASRLRRAVSGPVNVFALEGALQRLQRHSRVERLHARLVPGEAQGESHLTLEVEEARSYEAGVEWSNLQPSSIGSDPRGARGELFNLAGYGDRLALSFDRSEGLREGRVRYTLPLGGMDTELSLHASRSESSVVTSDLADLDFTSESRTFGFGLRHPFLRDGTNELWLGFIAERRSSETFIFGDQKIALAPGSRNGKTTVSALRLVQEWTQRRRRNVFSARSTVSLGFDVLGASDLRVAAGNAEPPDGRFAVWLGQLQWAHQLDERFGLAEIVGRADAQLASDRLLSLEKFAVGGFRTVRGYHENELVRDNALVGSIELRYPIWRDSLGRPVLQLAPFYDIGRAWDNGGPFAQSGSESMKTLSSAGLGMRLSLRQGLLAELYWGRALRKVRSRGSGIQNHGFHFRVRAHTF